MTAHAPAKATATLLAAGGLAALALGAMRLLARFSAGCDTACAALTSYEGAFLTVAALFLGALAVLAWPASKTP